MTTDLFSLLHPALAAADTPDIPASRLVPAALVGIAVIVVLITRFKLHPFLGLTLGSLTVGGSVIGGDPVALVPNVEIIAQNSIGSERNLFRAR